MDDTYAERLNNINTYSINNAQPTLQLEYDPLTGLLSRSSFLEKAQNDLPNIIKRYRHAVIITLDLKDMKGFNSNYGQEEGDHLLCCIANILNQHFGNNNCSRFGEDRYYVFTAAVGIDIELDGIIKQIQNLNNGHTLPVRIGLCSIDEDTTSIDIACNRARMACDTLRNNYNSGFVWFDESLADENAKKEYIVKNLDNAIKNEWIKVYLQPVIRTLTGELCGFEALTRWDDPEYGMLMPGDYIQLLELNRLSNKLDNFVILKVAQILKDRQIKVLPLLPISVNFSRADFVIDDPVKNVVSIVNEYDLRPGLINIEITETSLVSDHGVITNAIDRFHDEGFEVWMDDFGSGYSSLNVLKDFYFDEIKIDMAFFRNFNNRAKTIVSMIVEMAKKLGMHTLAEGVENENQFAFLKSVGCEKVQGNFFGSAMSYSKIVPYLRDRNLKWEARNTAVMYDKAGLTNVIFDNPVALFLYDGKIFKCLYNNEDFSETLLTAGYNDVTAFENNINLPENPKGRKCRDLAYRAKNHASEEYITFLANDKYYKLSFRILASTEDSAIIYATMDQLVYDDDKGHTSELDTLARKIMFNYGCIHYVDMVDHTTTIIASNLPTEKVGTVIEHAETYYSDTVIGYIHPNEKDRWKTFTSIGNIKNKLKNNKRGTFSSLFRMRQVDGSYEWTEFNVTSFRGANAKKLLVSSKRAIINDPEILENTEDLLNINASDDSINISENLWDIMTNRSGAKFFWKDRNLRFLGASKAFYDYYDITPEQLIGKTDVELGFQIDSTESKKAEEKVINKGEVILSAIRQNIVNGSIHHIAVTKHPMYNKGKICGLMGFFIDTEQDSTDSPVSKINLTDPVTGLMNVRGLMVSVLDLDDNYRKNRDNYMYIALDIPEYTDIQADFGDKASDELLKEAASILQGVFKTNFILARTSGAQFAICKQTASINDMMDLIQRAVNRIHDIHELNSFKCTIHADYGMSRASETNSVQDVVSLAISRMRKMKEKDY